MATNKNSRDAILKGVNKQNIDPFLVKDWSRDSNLQFPMRNHIRQWVREEFLNRWRNFGLNFTHTGGGEATDYPIGFGVDQSVAINAVTAGDSELLNDWDQSIYKGPKTAWARVVSSAIVEDPITGEVKKGFVLGGNGNFHDTYGFDRGDGVNGGGGEAKTLLGYECDQDPNADIKKHEIDEPDYKFRPSPGVVSVESEDIEPGKNFRRTTVNFTCWSQAQLDYLEPYFFQPGMTLIVEWGWNTYPKEALLDLSARGYKTIHGIWNNEGLPVSENIAPDDIPPSPAAYHLRKGNGNYGFAMGFISNFNYSIREDGGYDCSVMVSCMSEVGQQIMNKAGADKRKDSNKYIDIKTFINTTLRRSLMGKNDVGANINDGLDPEDQKVLAVIKGESTSTVVSAAEQEAVKIARGRYFTFNKYNSAKPFMAGKSNANGGTYITVGYLIDIFNIFFNRVSDDKTRIVEFSCYGSRCIAHPNIKSVDGSVLLIPNSVAPRWNKETFHGSTVSRINTDGSTTDGAGFSVLKKGESSDSRGCYKEITKNFIDILRSMNPAIAPGATLQDALQQSPRDDLHRLLTVKSLPGYNLQHPAIAGKLDTDLKNVVMKESGKKVDRLKEAWEESEDTVRPFPDFHVDAFKTGNTMGYSGRIQDLYVSLDVITNSFESGENATAILLDIMKKVSTAAGDIWKFNVIGGDLNTSSNSVLQLVDQNFSGSEPVSTQKYDAWVFPSHRGDSIVRELDLSVEPSSEMASMIVFGNLDKKNGFFAKEERDLILQGAKNPFKDLTQQVKNVDDKPKNIEDPEKYIVSASSKYFGIKNASNSKLPSYPIDKGKYRSGRKNVPLGPYDVTYTKPNSVVRIRLKASSRAEQQRNIEKAKKDGDEKSIKTGSRTPKANRYASSTGGGDIAQPRTYEIQVDGDFVNKVGTKEGMEGSTSSDVYADGNLVPEANAFGDDKVTQYPNRFPKYLVGKVIKYGDYTSGSNDVFVEDGHPEPDDDKKYKIVSATTYFGSDKTEFPYQIHLQELEGEETGLNESALQLYHVTKQTHGDDFEDHLPDRLKKYIDDNDLDEDYLSKQEVLVYHNTGNKYKKMSVVRGPIRIEDDSYGVDGDDYEIQIELVDIDRNRMVEFCESDASPKNNMVNNMPIPGVDLSLTIDGIEGLRLYDTFNCAGVPLKYFDRGIFAITGVKHSIADGDWVTTIESHYYPG